MVRNELKAASMEVSVFKILLYSGVLREAELIFNGEIARNPGIPGSGFFVFHALEHEHMCVLEARIRMREPHLVKVAKPI